MNVFNSYHPLSGFLYFCAVIIFPAVFMHPVILAISLLAAVSYCIFLSGAETAAKSVLYGIAFTIFFAAVNTFFNHRGITVLCYMGDNPITAEAVIYGISSAAMVVGIIVWFMSYCKIISSDKFVFLFGKFSPTVALVISMTLRFVPLLRRRYEKIDVAQKGFECGDKTNFALKIKNVANKLSSLMSSSLESSIISADSMKARGYGKRRRSCYSSFKFTVSDVLYCTFVLACSVAMSVIIATGSADITYFPYFKMENGAAIYAVCTMYFAVSFSPLIIEAVEKIRWSFIR